MAMSVEQRFDFKFSLPEKSEGSLVELSHAEIEELLLNRLREAEDDKKDALWQLARFYSSAKQQEPTLEKILAAIRRRCKRVRIILRGDSGFCREEIMAWCEVQPHVVHYCLGLAKNSVLIERLQPALADARARRCLSGDPNVRGFTEFEYRHE
jgi:hypothetical protein